MSVYIIPYVNHRVSKRSVSCSRYAIGCPLPKTIDLTNPRILSVTYVIAPTVSWSTESRFARESPCAPDRRRVDALSVDFLRELLVPSFVSLFELILLLRSFLPLGEEVGEYAGTTGGVYNRPLGEISE